MATTSSRPITVSIVSHGQADLVAPLLELLERHCAAWIDKIVLTANIPEHPPRLRNGSRTPIEFVVNAQPRGFGANHNAAFLHCESPWFLVLNPDIRLEADTLGVLLAQALADTGLLAPRIVEPGKSAPEPHRALITPCEILMRQRAGYQAPAEPAWVPGMFMLFRAAAYRQLDGFDERYYMYGEDFDVCARLRLEGWRLQVAEQLQVRHEAQRASRHDWRHLKWHFTSLARVWLSKAFWRYKALQSRR